MRDRPRLHARLRHCPRRLLPQAAVLAITAALSSTVRGDEPPRPEPPALQKLVTEKFEIYASTAERIETARAELERVWRRFDRYVGDPPRVAVVIHDDIRQVDSFNPATFENRGVVVLPWFDWKSFVADVEQHLGYVLALGMMAESIETPGVVRLVVAIPFEQRDHTLQVGDEILRVGDVDVVTVKELQDALSEKAEGESATLEVRRDDEVMEIDVVCTKRTNAAAPQFEIGGDAAAMAARGNPISHEIAHLMLIKWLEEKLDRKRDVPPTDASYGHPSLPDWLDEGVATLCETAALQETRRAHTAVPIPLQELLDMEHPLDSHDAREHKPEQAVRINVGFQPAGEGGGQHVGDFYSSALLLTEFLAQQGPPRCLSEIALGLADGRALEDILPELNGLPETLEDCANLLDRWLALAGAWQREDGSSAVHILPERLVVHHRGRSEVMPIERFTGSSLLVGTPAGNVELRLSLEDTMLTIAHPLLKLEAMRRTNEIPAGLLLEAYELPEANQISPEEAKKIADALAELVEQDQAARHQLMKNLADPKAQRAVRDIDRQSTAFVLETIRKHGWIDAERFGPHAVADAWLLVHHSNDLRLQITALPFIAQADEAGELRGAELALFRDRVVQKLGGSFWAEDLGLMP